MLVKAGQAIKLNLQLSDEDASAFPQAELIDETGSPIAGSPVNLSHVSNGLYTDDSISMPAVEVVYAQYKTFIDSGYTQRHPVHCDTLLDVFERDFNGEKIDQIANNITANEGVLDFISGLVEDEGELQGQLLDDGQLFGTLEDEMALVGVIVEPEVLVGTLYSSDEISGMIDC